ncbi:MAG: AMP-binding protein [Anaeromicrobium sp.]|jgi:phenylacetate-coenzyme A ligase PaaK-like adenylate-forming protein|uniref:DVU_1553 family AMP-dependent CoA ligase n=1 Tax=Anaeromicrobium sp. TaxID=1929132 RepID=UPI0025E3A9DB|nr:AMP-binding protein [Anaeromicrobium sp.]MCT4594157.1 AMP-binding protein [Anaeromicrobium sp.]
MNITPLDKWIRKKIGHKGSNDFRRELDNYILDKLRENIEYVKKNSVFYKNHLRELGEIYSFNDFEKIPFTRDSHIMCNPNHFVCVPQNHINRIVTLKTSGTTGERKRIFFTRDDQELTIDFFKIGMSTLVQKGDRVLILLPGEREGSVGDLLKKGLKRMGVKAYIHGPIYDPEKVLKIIKNKKINSLVAIPTQVLSLIRNEKNKDKIKLKSVLLSTDYAPKAVINQVERFFKCKVYDHYGMTEMGLGAGVQCDALEGFHLREADLYFEIINPVTREVVPKGEYGEVVFTTLTRRGMPLIRYGTGDISRIINKPCPCGTALKSLDRIIYRRKGAISLSQGHILTIGQLDEILFSIREIGDYDGVMTNDGKRDCLTIYVNMEDPLGERLFPLIYNRLEECEIIKKLIKGDKLTLHISMKGERKDCSKGTEKRKIIDKRILNV